MKRKRIVIALLGVFAVLLLATPTLLDAAPQKGFVLVRTFYPDGSVAPFVPLSIFKLSGNYPVPPGRYQTDAFGRIWVALYPGTYRFIARVPGAQPDYWDVPVASRAEIPIYFIVPSPGK